MSITLSAMWAKVQGAEPRTDGPTQMSLRLLQNAVSHGQATWPYVSWATGCECLWPGQPGPVDAAQALNSYLWPESPHGVWAGAIIGHLYGLSDEDVEQFIVEADADQIMGNALTTTPSTVDEIVERADEYVPPEQHEASLKRLCARGGATCNDGLYLLE